MLFDTIAAISIVFVAILARILAEDAKSFVPRLAVKLLTIAAQRLHPTVESRYKEEWISHSCEIPELSGKLLHSASIYFYGSSRLANQVGRSPSCDFNSKFSIRLIDRLMVILSLPVISVVILAIAVFLKLIEGKALYKEEFVGLGERRFNVWLLGGGNGKFSRALRVRGLDYLTAVFNVLDGTITLVGPSLKRSSYKDLPQEYFLLRPGLSGYGAISAKEMSIESECKHYLTGFTVRRYFYVHFAVCVSLWKDALSKVPTRAKK